MNSSQNPQNSAGPSLEEQNTKISLRDNKLDLITTRTIDYHQRRITNAHPSVDEYDYVVRKELLQSLSDVQQINQAVFIPITLLVKNTTVGNNIADNLPLVRGLSISSIVAVLRLAITADLVIRIKYYVGVTATTVVTITIPLATVIRTPITFSSFTVSTLPLGSVLAWDITASDGQIDKAGVATLILVTQ